MTIVTYAMFLHLIGRFSVPGSIRLWQTLSQPDCRWAGHEECPIWYRQVKYAQLSLRPFSHMKCLSAELLLLKLIQQRHPSTLSYPLDRMVAKAF